MTSPSRSSRSWWNPPSSPSRTNSRAPWYAGVQPDRITIYRLPILRHCWSRWEVVDQVAKTVVHEVGHYFGITDHRLHELGY